jgi:two-component system, chemotaxis family, CheB/CheR fusion protein
MDEVEDELIARRHTGSPRPGPRLQPRVDELEGELRETLRRYEIIFKATHDILYDLHLETSKVVWNEALSSQFGYDDDEATDTLEWWTDHIHPDDALGVEHAITELILSGGNDWTCEYRFLKADGSYADVRDRGYLLRDAKGTPYRIIGSFLDISKQKQLERAKDEFSSLISHQLRTPLTVIQIYSNLLAAGAFGALTDAQATEILKINNSAVKLIGLVNDILAISSVELQRLELSPVETDMNDLIQSCVDAVRPLADKKSLSLDFRANRQLKPVMIDPRIFEQVLHNLLTNAIRYSPEYTGQVDVGIRSRDKGYLVTVKDNGIGIPAADKPYIFERFYRANNTANTEDHGTGLGLYYVQLVTTAFGGKVWFKSAKGKGTTFYLSIPRST